MLDVEVWHGGKPLMQKMARNSSAKASADVGASATAKVSNWSVKPAQFLNIGRRYFSLLLALLVWWLWYRYTAPDSLAIVRENVQVALTMVFGSFIAGATSEGGGAVAFPVFTKLLQVSPLDAKIFSLAIQSVGMTAATLSILALRVKISWPVIFWASLGGVPGIVFGAIVLTPLLPPELLRMAFTAMVAGLALTLILVNWYGRERREQLPRLGAKAIGVLLLSGFFGGTMSGLVGNGIDIICFSVMVFLFGIAEKVATPTSVVLMALNALAGFALHAVVSPQIQSYWLAAIPVVVIGTPAGAYFCARLNNKVIAGILIFLITVELVSSLLIIPMTTSMTIISLLMLLFFFAANYLLSRASINSWN